ncbi:polypyrimidine tract-binding protein homolog 2 isoform X1 [Tanacetum coccineum]
MDKQTEIKDAAEGGGSMNSGHLASGMTDNGNVNEEISEKTGLAHEWNDPKVQAMKQSFVNVVTNDKPKPKVNFISLVNKERVENSDFVLPIDAIIVAHNKFANSLVCYFVGKTIAFPIVKNYVTNTWGKYGFQKVIKDDDRFACALIEVSAGKELKQEVIMDVPNVEGTRHTKERIRIEVIKTTPPTKEVQSDGFSTVSNRKKKGKSKDQSNNQPNKKFVGLKLNKQKSFVYQPKATPDDKDKEKSDTNVVKLNNHFDVLSTQDEQETNMDDLSKGKGLDPIDPNPNIVDSKSEVEEAYVETFTSEIKEASTSSPKSLNVCSKVFRFWEWTSNASLCDKGCRIILRWNIDVVDLMVISQSNQAMHVKLVHKATKQILFVLFIYATNLHVVRPKLWSELGAHEHVVRGLVLMGEFNVALNLEDYYSGSSTMSSAMIDFKECVSHINVMDINSSGIHFTWNQKLKGGGGVLKKLDRIMGNIEFSDAFQGHLGPNFVECFHSHIKCFLGSSMACDNMNTDGLFHNKVSDMANTNMVRTITDVEIKAAMFDIDDDRAPGPDGYTSAFSKKLGILFVWSINQSTFITGRNISDNILITQELMHNYHRNRGPPRCTFKVDIQKAYDTVDWHFIGKRGLRQGDPLSPYLFTLVMEVLTLMLKRRVRLSDSFQYHNHCEKLQIINVCFADDLFIFACGDVESARVIMESLDEFKSTSGLVSSIPKSITFFYNVLNHVKIVILNIMSFSEG